MARIFFTRGLPDPTSGDMLSPPPVEDAAIEIAPLVLQAPSQSNSECKLSRREKAVGCSLITGCTAFLGWFAYSMFNLPKEFDIGGIARPGTNFTKGDRLPLVPDPSTYFHLSSAYSVVGYDVTVSIDTSSPVNCTLFSSDSATSVMKSTSVEASFPSTPDSAIYDSNAFLAGLSYSCDGDLPAEFDFSIHSTANLLRDIEGAVRKDSARASMRSTIFYRPEESSTDSSAELSIAA